MARVTEVEISSNWDGVSATIQIQRSNVGPYGAVKPDILPNDLKEALLVWLHGNQP
jgi:hypothetical protein